MTQTVPATAVLGPGLTGLTIGLRVLNLDGTEYAAFSTTGVAETSVAGTYRKAGGVVCPDAGGYIVWGVSGTDYAEATVESDVVGTVTTVTNLTNAPTAGDLTATMKTSVAAATWNAVAASYATAGTFGALVGGIATIATTLQNRLGAWTGTGVNTVLGAFKAALSKSATVPSDIGGTFDPAADSAEAISEAIAGVGGATGSGAISFPVTVNDEDSNPIDGVEVWISTDSAGTSVVAGTLSTDALGLATFMLDAGTYYLWRQKSGYNFTNPVTIVVS